MDLQLSSRVQAIKPSPTLAVTNKAAELRAAGQDRRTVCVHIVFLVADLVKLVTQTLGLNMKR